MKPNNNRNEKSEALPQGAVSSSFKYRAWRGATKTLLRWLNVDLDKYETLKSDNRKLKNKIKDIDTELKFQIEENKLPCRYLGEDINNHYPKDNGLKNIADAYNKSANTERLIYGQKIKFLKTIIDKNG